MSPLERLFRLEIESHRRLRSSTAGAAQPDPYASYALQSVYNSLIRDLGSATTADIDLLRQRLALAGDTRDVLAASDSLKKILGIPLMGS
jgi:hypothetical protein